MANQPIPTIVLGASPNKERYAYKAVLKLRTFNHPVYALGPREGTIADVKIHSTWPKGEYHTLTLYLGPDRQAEYTERILNSGVQRVIFNPGTENPALESALHEAGIEALRACTLVLLSIGNY